MKVAGARHARAAPVRRRRTPEIEAQKAPVGEAEHLAGEPREDVDRQYAFERALRAQLRP